MKIVFKFKDGTTINQKTDELKKINIDDGFLNEIKKAKTNNETLKAETNQGLIEKPLSELTSIEFIFD